MYLHLLIFSSPNSAYLLITFVPDIILNTSYRIHVLSVFTEFLLWARRQILITTVRLQ